MLSVCTLIVMFQIPNALIVSLFFPYWNQLSGKFSKGEERRKKSGQHLTVSKPVPPWKSKLTINYLKFQNEDFYLFFQI